MAKQTENTELKLYKVVKGLYAQVNVVFAGIDVGITISKMSEEQQLDMLALIKYFRAKCAEHKENPDETASYILAQVTHDLNGLKAGFLGLPGSDCFSPRSRGYAKTSS